MVRLEAFVDSQRRTSVVSKIIDFVDDLGLLHDLVKFLISHGIISESRCSPRQIERRMEKWRSEKKGNELEDHMLTDEEVDLSPGEFKSLTAMAEQEISSLKKRRGRKQ